MWSIKGVWEALISCSGRMSTGIPSFHSSSSLSSSPMVFSKAPSDCFDALVEYSLKRFVLPLPSARGMFPMLSLGSSLGNSTFASSSSCAGGRPDRRQILSWFSARINPLFAETYSLSTKYAIQNTRFRCSISWGLRLKPDPRLCKPMLWASRIAAAMRKNDGWGFGVPSRNSA